MLSGALIIKMDNYQDFTRDEETVGSYPTSSYEDSEQGDVPDNTTTGQPEKSEVPLYATFGKSAEDVARRAAKKPKGSHTTVMLRIFGKAARTWMWIVGVIVGITLIFLCVLAWIYGLQFLGYLDNNSSKVETQSGDTYNFYVFDGSANGNGSFNSQDDFEDYFNEFFSNGNGDNSGEDAADPDTQSGTPGLGITITPLELQFTIDDKYTAGLVIYTIEENSSFTGTDVQVNDMIVAIDGIATPDTNTLKNFLATKAVGDEVTVTVARYKTGVAATFDVTVNLIDMDS